MSMLSKLFLSFFVTSSVAFASSTSGAGETDFAYRTINFVIFASIAYYLLADLIKNYFSDRTKSIQSQIDEVQEALKQSEQRVKEAKEELANAKVLASELVDAAKNEISKIEQKVEQTVASDIQNLHKQFDQKIELETKKMRKDVVRSVVDKLFSADTVNLSSKELGNIISAKVA